MLKLGNTYFTKEYKNAFKDMPFKEFEKTYKNILKGISLEDAYSKLTGKTVKKSVKKDSEEN